MPKRRWYRSLYSKIAIGYVVLLALLLLVQTSLAVWMSGRMWGRASRTPAQLAEMVAQDLQTQLSEFPPARRRRALAVEIRARLPAVRRRASRRSDETFSNRPTAIPPPLGRRRRGAACSTRASRSSTSRRGRRGARAFAEYADIIIDGKGDRRRRRAAQSAELRHRVPRDRADAGLDRRRPPRLWRADHGVGHLPPDAASLALAGRRGARAR